MNDDLIKRSDAIKALRKLGHEVVVIDKVCSLRVAAEFIDAIRAIPSADIPKKVIAQITFDEEKLREIVKEAVERFKEEYEITDRPQEWIPCSERLPSDYSDYLVIDGDGEMAVGNYRDDADAWDNGCFGWLERNEDDEQPTRLGKVVAWMPLPEPWKGADDE